jgi:CubicO group peptidase (beta-lactamase class C family)
MLAMRLTKLGKNIGAIGIVLLALNLGCVSGTREKSTSLNRSIDHLFAQWNKPNSPGCALAVIKDGKVIYEHGYGCANLEYGTPITPSTVFNIASATKQFTAMCVLMLAQQGKLSLDDDIRKHVPEVPDFGKVITLRHLLHHSSGLRDLEEMLSMAGWRMYGDVITRQHMLDMVSHQKELNFNPGDEFLYCNMGYCLLAETVRRVSGHSFAAYAEANIFQLLGMTNTHVHDDYERIVRNRANSYEPAGDKSFKNVVDNGAAVGGGGIYSTVEDLVKWVNNFEDGRVGGPEILKRMHEPGVLNNGERRSLYACGLYVDDYKGVKMVAHGGAWAGYRSDIIRFPDQKVAVILLANTSTIDALQLSRKVADIVLFGARKPIEPQPPKSTPAPAMAVNAEKLEAFCGVYEFKPGTFGTVTREGNRLYVEATEGPKVELWPEAENAFLIQEDGSRVSFERDERGLVDRFVVRKKSKDITPNLDRIFGITTYVARRINPLRAPLRAEELAEFVGDYSSDELGTTYTIFVRNGELFAQQRRLGDSRLKQLAVRDQFSGEDWLPYHFAFVRDARNQVTGFKLTGDRNRNVRFEKRGETLPGPSQRR